MHRCRLLLAALLTALATAWQAAPAAAQEPAADARNIRVFFDCNAFCDDNYIRTESPWIAFVRDRTDADVHLLITSLSTGAGGSEYTLNFVGLGALASRNDTLRHVVQALATDDERRRGVTRAIQLGLAPFVARLPAARPLRVVVADEDDERRRPPVAASDPWRAWVFEINANGSLEEEQRQSGYNWGGSFDARRITSAWKFGASMSGHVDEQHFTIEEDSGPPTKFTSVRRGFSGGATIVRSHGGRLATGAQVRASSSTFSNTEFAFRAAPAIEFSFFPYDEFTRRQLTLQYSAGVSAFGYNEETIYGKVRETRPTHALVLGYDINQRWGSADITLETARYIDNASQWRFEFDGELDIRLFRGFELEIGANASLIRDQLGIAARNATPEEILLELRDLQTDYRYDVFVGISYTFGSIFSAVVNPRFGTGPGNILR